MDKKIKPGKEEEASKPKIYGDPEYPAADDIYSRGEKLGSIDADENTKSEKGKKKLTGEDLDIPGAELDDHDEEIGEEDEENNYYSLGGDDHNDLEEDKGDE